jgi:hypothetical protein
MVIGQLFLGAFFQCRKESFRSFEAVSMAKNSMALSYMASNASCPG